LLSAGCAGLETIEEIAYLNDICDRLGMDTISAGNLVGLAMEATQLGKTDETVPYGDVDKIAELLKDMAYGRGLGGILNQGIKSAARELGLEDQAISCERAGTGGL
jgi:aldehyde:ferredoxin oxidoreductase